MSKTTLSRKIPYTGLTWWGIASGLFFMWVFQALPWQMVIGFILVIVSFSFLVLMIVAWFQMDEFDRDQERLSKSFDEHLRKMEPRWERKWQATRAQNYVERCQPPPEVVGRN